MWLMNVDTLTQCNNIKPLKRGETTDLKRHSQYNVK